MEINFIANEIVYEVTEYNSYLVGFADDKNEPKEYVIVERALEFDEQDIKLGMDSYYFEYSDQSNSGYDYATKSFYVKMRLSFRQNINVWMILLQ